jgi:hypothetical protein
LVGFLIGPAFHEKRRIMNRNSAIPLDPADNSHDAAIAAAERITQIPIDEMVTDFEPLGAGCELGFIQRWCGAEPLSLFRFGFMPIEAVTAHIEAGFAGLDDEATMEPIIRGETWEMVQRTPRGGLIYHTFRRTDEFTEAALKQQQSRFLRFQARKLMGELVQAKKTFVIWGGRGELALPDVERLFGAMRACGPSNLLWVVSDTPVGLVEEIRPGLYRGRIDRIPEHDDKRPAEVRYSMEGWMAVLANAWLLRRSEVASPEPVQS